MAFYVLEIKYCMLSAMLCHPFVKAYSASSLCQEQWRIFLTELPALFPNEYLSTL